MRKVTSINLPKSPFYDADHLVGPAAGTQLEHRAHPQQLWLIRLDPHPVQVRSVPCMRKKGFSSWIDSGMDRCRPSSGLCTKEQEDALTLVPSPSTPCPCQGRSPCQPWHHATSTPLPIPLSPFPRTQKKPKPTSPPDCRSVSSSAPDMSAVSTACCRLMLACSATTSLLGSLPKMHRWWGPAGMRGGREVGS